VRGVEVARMESTDTPKRGKRSKANPPRIGRKGPPIAEVLGPLSTAAQLVDYGALNAEPQEWFRTMERADRGDTGPQLDTFEDARLRDSHLDGVCAKRTQSMMSRPIVVRPPDGYEHDREALEAAQLNRRILLSESRGFRSRLVHLMAGTIYGYSAGPLRWTTNWDGLRVPHIEEAALNRFAFKRETLQIGFYAGPYRSSWEICPLADYPDCFIVHTPLGGRSGYAWRRGAERPCIIPSYLKRKGLRFWLVLAERFGMPQPYATIPEGLDDDDGSEDNTVRTVKNALKNLSANWSMVVSKGIEIGVIPGSGKVDSSTHKDLIDWAEMTESIAVLGQNLSTKVEGGSFAAAEAHRFVAADLHLADAVELGETLTQQLSEPITRYNMPGAPVPVVEISTGTKQVPERDDVIAGIFSDDERRRAMGHDAKPDGQGADYRRPVTVQVPEQIGGPSAAP
jgi:phage gp29-like protein